MHDTHIEVWLLCLYLYKRELEKKKTGKIELRRIVDMALHESFSVSLLVLLKNGFHSCDDCILYMKFETTKEKTCVLVVGGRCVCKIKGRVVNKEKDRKTS